VFYFFKSVNTRKEFNIFNFQLESLNFLVVEKKNYQLKIDKIFFLQLRDLF
jgi:hypothetical protein